jgi:NAD(P) transhydrogenase subunit alpha
MYLIDILILSCFIGYFAILNVTPMLHSPLMSVTNAISGIIILGGFQTLNNSSTTLENILLYFAIFFASLNIFGGFCISGRMLNMFKKKDKQND